MDGFVKAASVVFKYFNIFEINLKVTSEKKMLCNNKTIREASMLH